MGYTPRWEQKRAFTDAEWKLILGEAERIIAKAARGCYYTGEGGTPSHGDSMLDGLGVRPDITVVDTEIM